MRRLQQFLLKFRQRTLKSVISRKFLLIYRLRLPALNDHEAGAENPILHSRRQAAIFLAFLTLLKALVN